jgi:hypothetical protein
LGAFGFWLGCRHYKIPLAPVADALAPAIVVAQAIGRLGNYFNQELFGSPTTLPWGLEVYLRTPGGVAGSVQQCVDAGVAPEFPTDFIKATPEVLCGVYHPTFLYELIWDLLVAAVIVWADRKFRLGGGRVFALYVAGYTAGRGWIEALRIDPARTHILGLRVNIVVSIVVFLLAVAYLIWRRKVGREDPAVVAGPGGADKDSAGVPPPAAEGAADAAGVLSTPVDTIDGAAAEDAGETAGDGVGQPTGDAAAEVAGEPAADVTGEPIGEAGDGPAGEPTAGSDVGHDSGTTETSPDRRIGG